MSVRRLATAQGPLEGKPPVLILGDKGRSARPHGYPRPAYPFTAALCKWSTVVAKGREYGDSRISRGTTGHRRRLRDNLSIRTGVPVGNPCFKLLFHIL